MFLVKNIVQCSAAIQCKQLVGYPVVITTFVQHSSIDFQCSFKVNAVLVKATKLICVH